MPSSGRLNFFMFSIFLFSILSNPVLLAYRSASPSLGLSFAKDYFRVLEKLDVFGASLEKVERL